MSYPDQSHSTTFTSASSSPAASSNVIENELCGKYVCVWEFDALLAQEWQDALLGCSPNMLYEVALRVGSPLGWRKGYIVEEGSHKALLGVEFAMFKESDHEGERMWKSGECALQVLCEYMIAVCLRTDAVVRDLNCSVLYAEDLKKELVLFVKFNDEEGYIQCKSSDLETKDIRPQHLFIAGSRNRLTSVLADSRNSPTSVPARRPFFAGWKNHAARPMTRPTSHYFQHFSRPGYYTANCIWNEGREDGELLLRPQQDNPHKNKDLGIVDSGCSRSMTGNKEKLDDFVKIMGGTVTFGGGDGKITGKGIIRTSKLNFENVYYVEELQNFNLFSAVLRVPRRHNLYSFNLTKIQPERDITCLLAKASFDESTKWHRRMAHVNFKNINKLVKHGLVNGLPSKLFTNDHNCVACNKGKQHKASYKAITAVSTISEPLQLLHMDLFGPTSIRSIDHKYYSLVVTDDLSRFSWVFFLGTKDETYYILKDFITFIENQLNKKVKAIRCDNGTEFKNSKLIELCGSKGIKRDYSNARTPQQNGVAERKNRTLIEAARTMLADSKLPTMFWTEAVSTACYVLNRVLVTRPHNKTPYELLSGKVPNISHLKPFGCHVTILNTSDHLGKFEGKADEGFIVGYAAHSKAYRVYNLSSKKIEETLNLRYLEDKPNVQGLGQEWYFDLDYLTDSLGYTRFKSNQPAGTQDPHIHAGTQDDSDSECDEQVIVVPSFPSNRFSGPKVHEASEMVESNSDYAEELARLQRQEHEAKDTAEKYGFGFSKDTEEHLRQADMVPAGSIDPAASISAGSIDPAASISAGSAEPFPTVIEPVHADETSLPPGHSLGSSEHSTRFPSPSDLANSISSSSEMEDIYHHPSTGIFSSSSYDADFGGTVTNLAPIVAVDPVPTKRVNTIHPQSQILGDLTSPVQTRGTLKKSKFGESTFVSYVHDQQRNNHTDYLHSMQEEMHIIQSEKYGPLVPLPNVQFAIMTKWNFERTKEMPEGIESDKARLVTQNGCEECFSFREIEKKVMFTQPKGFEESASSLSILQRCESLYGLHHTKAWLTMKQNPDGSLSAKTSMSQTCLMKIDRKSMIGSHMYFEQSFRPDISCSKCFSRHHYTLCFQLNAVKKIFKYLKGQRTQEISPLCWKHIVSVSSSSQSDRKSPTGGFNSW
ncbi:putative ribonuclease H-like domain-containing protein [Tanacetum coccineum]|uniref:Ribonuclease H-like domain-containing protein n=1 Tax=Tanacetum coccineum TaxID=301880 RepID=A0ABQ4Y441_9ASTR